MVYFLLEYSLWFHYVATGKVCQGNLADFRFFLYFSKD